MLILTSPAIIRRRPTYSTADTGCGTTACFHLGRAEARLCQKTEAAHISDIIGDSACPSDKAAALTVGLKNVLLILREDSSLLKKIKSL